jgi:hypothetical protein
MDTDDLIAELTALETEGWQALSSDGSAAHEFYDRVLDDDPIMLLPGGLVLDQRSHVLASMSGAPWKSFELEDLDARIVNDDVGIVTYRAIAERRGRGEYVALMASVYVRRADGWKLVLHQQTPDDED